MRLRRFGRATSAFMFVSLAFVAGGCGEGGLGGGGEKGDKIKIGFSMDTLKEERWVRDKELVERFAKEAGAEIETQVANGDNAMQSKQAENFLTKGVDVLIIAPHDGVVAASIVEMAKRQNVPVVSYDRLIRNSDVNLYVSHQVKKMGEMQARYALEKKPRGNYVLIGGAPTDNNALLLREGQMAVLQPAVDSGAINIVSNQFARDWLREEALRFTADALTSTGNKIDAIVASNDGTAGGAIAALGAAGIPPGQVLVTGQDAELSALQRIVQGEQTMTIYKPIQPLAKSAVDAAMKLARGETVEAQDRINNGKIDVPAVLHEPAIVDKSNVMETVVKDGYHKCEDVYKNVPNNPCGKATASSGPEDAENVAAARAEREGASRSAPFVASFLLLLSAFAWIRFR